MASSLALACELKSQYGHLRTHQGKWTYSESGGNAVNTGAPAGPAGTALLSRMVGAATTGMRTGFTPRVP